MRGAAWRGERQALELVPAEMGGPGCHLCARAPMERQYPWPKEGTRVTSPQAIEGGDFGLEPSEPPGTAPLSNEISMLPLSPALSSERQPTALSRSIFHTLAYPML